MKTVLFICTGNTCRSPMAEAIARHAIASGVADIDEDVFVASAGVFAGDGLPVSPETIQALKDLGIEHEGHSKGINAEMIRKADAVFCMTASQQAAVRGLANDAAESSRKIVRLDPGADLDDPIGHGQDAYTRLAQTMMKLIPRRLKEMLDHEDRARIRSSR